MSKLEDQTVDDICQHLEQHGFSDTVIKYVKDEELDGDAIVLGLASDPGPSWLKDIIPKMGVRLKVHSVLRSLYLSQLNNTEDNMQEENDLAALIEKEIVVDDHEFTHESTPMSLSSVKSSSSSLLHDDCSVNEGSKISSGRLTSSSTKSTTHREGKHSAGGNSKTANRKLVISEQIKHGESSGTILQPIPEPFPIPAFRLATENNLALKKRSDSDRKYIVQTLATMLMTFKQKPSLNDCGKVAKALISKFTFLKDDEGDGEHSWKWFIYYRCNNVNRSTKEDYLPRSAKKAKLENNISHLYPIHDGEDKESFKRNMDLLKQEMQKPSRRPDVIKSLLSRTFPNRWNSFVNNNQPETLAEYIQQFPVLKKCNYVSLEFSLATKKDNIRDNFEETFPLWAKAIVVYCKNSQQKNSMLKAETLNYSENLDEGRLSVMALRCLFLLFSASKTKTINEDGCIPFILNIVPRGTSPTVASHLDDNNQPHIINFADEELQQYFISVEHNLMMECSSLCGAIFYCVAAHYIFNLTYHPKTGEVWTFIQEKVLQIQSKSKAKQRSPSSLSHFSGISSVQENLSN